jgi:hypothetical protein
MRRGRIRDTSKEGRRLISAEGRIDDNSLLTRSTDLVFSEVDDEVTMMHVETGRYYGLNRVGAAVWFLLEEPARFGTICDALVERFEVEPEKCRAEVEAFVSQMATEGLVTITE